MTHNTNKLGEIIDIDLDYLCNQVAIEVKKDLSRQSIMSTYSGFQSMQGTLIVLNMLLDYEYDAIYEYGEVDYSNSKITRLYLQSGDCIVIFEFSKEVLEMINQQMIKQ